MDKTVKINLGGTLFQIDEESYRRLREYLQAIDSRFRNVPGGFETTEDIESRIAEIFLSQKGPTGVITKEDIEYMISILGKPEDFAQFESEAEPISYQPQKKRLYRNPDDRIIGGVCSGLGSNFDIDPVWIRLFFVLFTLFFGVGILIYVVLWIALPVAESDYQKKEMYGDAHYSSAQNRYARSSAGNAFNEIFSAFGKVFYVIFRVILIMFGVTLVVTGFMMIVTFVMVFLFKFPGSFSTDIDGVNLSYIPDFLNYIVHPALAPWISILVSMVVILPLLAFIYWGVKMIFWFRAKDGIVSLVAFVLWIISIAALSIILFNQGVSYTETARATTVETFKEKPDTLFIRLDRKISDLKYDHEISPDNDYEIFIAEENKEVFVRTYFRVESSENDEITVEVRKKSSGSTRNNAQQKAEGLIYNIKQSGDTLYLDEYFSYPDETKWAFDNVSVYVSIPESTVVHMDKETENFFRPRYRHYSNRYDRNFPEQENRFWKFSDERLRPIEQD
jgi:phage shock protein PspC (stress-responsive transcriptional regulator)